MTAAAESVRTARMADSVYDMPLTIADLFLYSAEKFDRSDALSFKFGDEWRRISSIEIVGRSEKIALGLHSIGVTKGDRVAILAANSPNWTLADAGCQFGGVIDVPIYTTLACDSVEYILRDSAAKAIFLQDKATYERIADAIKANPTLETVIFFDDAGNDVENSISLEELERRGEALRDEQPDLIDQLIEATSAGDIATLIYTSGTTGEPKGVMLTHANILSNVVDAAEKYTFEGRDVSLSVLPLSHIFERTGMYVYLMYGMAVHYAESIEKVPDNLKEVRPTIFIGVPRIFEKVYEKARIAAARSNPIRERIFDWAIEVAKEYASTIERGEEVSMALYAKHNLADKIVYQKFRDFFGGNLRFCITGGAALADEIYLIFTGAGIRIMQGYGLTETSPVISSNNPQNVRVGTVGKPIRNVEVRIAADGEIEARGPGVMLGYYHKEQATKEVFTDDGWFRTGDIGEIDADGYLKITDRKKELFKTSGGKYIAPSPIEQRIKASRFVSQAVLVGNERKFPAALIVPNFEMLESYAELKGLELKTPEDYCSNEKILDLFERQVAKETEGLSQFEKVKKIALLPAELTVDGGELTPTLKVKRRVIDEKYRAVIDELYS
ncbi:MAG TPA: long-chain fatty acid--CoA ligase [Pyrinomonadaceae bacterium]|mgnify:CR=1 FL=1|nr:long-chain fatty acid--CoA ligase [Pyrinomonadaceae bacterium]